MLIRVILVLFVIQFWSSAPLAFSTSLDKLDSLTVVLEKTTLVPLKADLHLEIGNLYLISNSEKALEHFNHSLSIAKEADYQLGLAHAYLAIGEYYFSVLDSFQVSLDYYERSLDIFLREKNADGIMRAYFKVGYADFVLSNYERAIKFIEVALYYSEDLGDKLFTMKSTNTLGLIYKNANKSSKAISHYEQALEIAREINDSEFIPKILKNLGNQYRQLGYSSLALKYYLEALELYRGSTDSIELADNLYRLGLFHSSQGNLDKAFEYQLEAFKIREKINSHALYKGESLSGLGGIYVARKNYKMGIEYYKKSLEFYKKTNRNTQIQMGYTSIGSAYEEMGRYKEALDYLNKALEMNKTYGTGGTRAYGNLMNNFARIHLAKRDYEQALSYVNNGMEVEVTPRTKKNCYQVLSDIYFQKEDYKKAFYYYRKYTTLHDSLVGLKKERSIQEFQTLYEVNQQTKEIELLKKEKEINLLTSNAEIKKQKSFRNAFILGGIALLIIATLIFSRYRLKNKANLLLTAKNQQIEDQNTHILDSITYAKRIQDAILTSDSYMDGALEEYFVFYRPKDIVSGDFYWVYELNPDSVMVAVADCTGHGVPGAFMSMIGNALLNELIIENGNEQVEKVLGGMRAHLIKTLYHENQTNKSMDGMDITLVKIDKKNQKLSFASAGHRLYHLRDGKCMDYKGDPFPVGAYYGEEQPFSSHEIDILKGDSIYLTSDGFTDQFGGPSRKKFGLFNFKELVLSNNYFPMDKQKSNFIKSFEDWKGDNSQIDDICVMGIRI